MNFSNRATSTTRHTRYHIDRRRKEKKITLARILYGHVNKPVRDRLGVHRPFAERRLFWCLWPRSTMLPVRNDIKTHDGSSSTPVEEKKDRKSRAFRRSHQTDHRKCCRQYYRIGNRSVSEGSGKDERDVCVNSESFYWWFRGNIKYINVTVVKYETVESKDVCLYKID